ncbi:MAG: putative porin [Chthoniobacter sp.]|nr:putative porin [Chthoniobacter sp.]
MSKTSPLQFAVMLTLISAGAAISHAQDAGALVDKLVKKGVLSSQEGEEVRADMMRDFATQTSAGKINLSGSITEMKLYGDFRLRYQYDDREAQIAAPNHVDQRSRWRYRLRLGADVAFGENWFAGFQLQSGQNSDSGNQTFSNGFDNDGIFISKAFFGFKNDWASVIAGKQKNPFYTTDMVWDPDINPAGVVERIDFHKLFGRGLAGPSGDYGTDGKSMAPTEVHGDSSWELSLVAGQLFYQDNNEFNIGTDFKTDGYLFVEQLIGTYHFNKDVSITLAPAWMTFTASHLTGLRNENSFTDTSNVLSTTTTQTTKTDRNRLVVNYDAAGNITGGTLQPFVVTATQVSSPTTTKVGGGSSTGSTTRTVTTDQVRSGATVNLTAAQAKAQAAALGLAQTGPANGQTQRDIDGVAVTTTNTVTLPSIAGETRKLNIITAPGDISFKIGSLKTKVYWDFAYNVDGEGRFNDIYQLRTGNAATDAYRGYKTRDGIAWLAGVQLGETKKKGDWSLNFNYRESGIASLDPNLNDSDFALSELNTRGFKLSLAYQLADVVVVNLTGMMAWNLDRNLSGGRATGGSAIAQDNAINVVQFDVNVKF